MRLHTSINPGSTERVTLISRLLSSGTFQAKDKNALWLMSVETLRKLADNARPPKNDVEAPTPNHRRHDIAFLRDDDEARQMLPPSLGDVIRRR